MTYRQLAELDFGILMCNGRHETCPRGWGWHSHAFGRVDRAGMIHWKQADARANRRGMRSFMKLVGLCLHREWWTEPNWKRLHLTNVFAYEEIRRRYHYRVKAEWSYQDRLKAKRFLERNKVTNLRNKDRNAYVWLANAGLRVVHSRSRRDVQREVAGWPRSSSSQRRQ